MGVGGKKRREREGEQEEQNHECVFLAAHL